MSAPILAGLEPEHVLASGPTREMHRCSAAGGARTVLAYAATPDADGRTAFLSEAEALRAASAHPGLLTVLDARIDAAGHPCLIAEAAVPGIAVRGATDLLSALAEAADGLEALHAAGLRHRRLTPGALMTTEDGRVVLADAALPSLAEPLDPDAEPWASPEARAAQRQRRTSDVYALAAVARTLLAERPLPDVPETLHRLLGVATAADPAQRPPSAAEFAGALRRIRAGFDDTDTDEAADAGADPDETIVVRRPDPDETIVVRRPVEDDTVVARRGPASAPAPAPASPEPTTADDAGVDERTRPAGVDEHTQLADVDDRTQVADLDDRTRVVGADDRTFLSGGTDTGDPTERAPRPGPVRSTPPAPPPGEGVEARRAVAPPAGARHTYAVRGDAPTPPITRAPLAPPPARDDAAAVDAARGRRRSLRVRLAVLLGAGTLTVAAAAAAVLLALTR